MKKLLVNVLLVFGISFGAKPAWAILIEFQPAAQMVKVGDSLGVDIVVSGLSAAGEIVSAYDLDVTYDASILSATDVAFGPFLGSDLTCFALSLCSFSLAVSGVVDIAEVSLLDDDMLAAIQPDAFTLATLFFEALAGGTSAFHFDMIDVKGRNARPIGVPEPGTLWLLVTGLILIVLARRQDIRRRLCLVIHIR